MLHQNAVVGEVIAGASENAVDQVEAVPNVNTAAMLICAGLSAGSSAMSRYLAPLQSMASTPLKPAAATDGSTPAVGMA